MASPGFLDANGLVGILSILRTTKHPPQLTEHLCHLALAVFGMDVMAEHKVKDLDLVQEHGPLSKVLSGYHKSSEPYLLY